MHELEYPFDSDYLLKKSKRIKRELLAEAPARLRKKIAVLGGSTTHDIIRILELFLLNYGIEPEFYESEYAQYWQDAMFSEELRDFAPDLVFIHTSNRNIHAWPEVTDDADTVQKKLQAEFAHFTAMWDKIASDLHCPIIQNNFELPFYRLFGNRDNYDTHGRVHFVNEMNRLFAAYAAEHESFYINDLMYLSSCYGLDKWSDPLYWHMYKYALCMPAIPSFAYSVANIIKSLYGKNKKALVLDLDNTLWGGVIGDDGQEGIEIGQETNLGQVYAEFQTYIRAHKDMGIMLNVDSKNEEENALLGLNHPDSVLHPDDFIYIKANWEPKSENLKAIARNINILPEAMVFVDDNPAEREIISQQVPGCAAPEIGRPEDYIRVLDHSGFFEVTNFSDADLKRNEMYKENAKRQELEESFSDYTDYLKSLEMKAQIRPFEEIYYPRISQLTNKSNQFNLTTLRCSVEDIRSAAEDPNKITLYGRLEDKFGDNGIVSLVMAEKEETVLHIRLWLMSCRVLKRDMEYAMMDKLVEQAKNAGITDLYGYYYPTAKNRMVENFYALHGFDKISEAPEGTTWHLAVSAYEARNHVITVN